MDDLSGLAGPADWWAAIKGRLRTEEERVRAFVEAGRAFQAGLGELPAMRAQLTALSRFPGPLAPRVMETITRRIAELAARQRDLESRGLGLLARVQAFITRGHGEKLRVDSIRGTDLDGIGELAGWILFVGIGALATALTAAMIAWLGSKDAQKRRLALAEQLMGDVRAGRIPVEAAERMIDSVREPAGPLAAFGSAAGLGIALLAAVVLLPRLLGGRRS